MKNSASFLSDMPREIESVLSWFRRGADRGDLTKATEEFVSGFLGAVHDDGALIPILKMYPPELLGKALTHHETSPDHPIAWLNLGFELCDWNTNGWTSWPTRSWKEFCHVAAFPSRTSHPTSRPTVN